LEIIHEGLTGIKYAVLEAHSRIHSRFIEHHRFQEKQEAVGVEVWWFSWQVQ